MAAFLTADTLRAHAAPASPSLPPADGRGWSRASPERRPVLAALWLVDADGGLTCRWQIEVSAPFGPPPD